MNLVKFFYIGLIIMPSLAWSSSVYLKCEVSTYEVTELGKRYDETIGSTKRSFSVNLDEITRNITQTNHRMTVSGVSKFNSKGSFSSSTISYGFRTKLTGIFRLHEQYEIDRSNLNINMELTVSDSLAYKKRGICVVEKTEHNKI